MNDQSQDKLCMILHLIGKGIMDIGDELNKTQKNQIITDNDHHSPHISKNSDDAIFVERGISIDPTNNTSNKIHHQDFSNTNAELLAERKYEAEEELNSLQFQISGCRSELNNLECKKQDLLNEIEDQKKLLVQIDERERNLMENEKKLTSLLVEYQAMEVWAKNILPSWCENEDLSLLKNHFIESIKQNRTQSAILAGLLLTSLVNYQYTLQLADERSIEKSVNELGQKLFSWLNVMGCDAVASVENAILIANHINHEAAGRFEVDIPIPGTPASPNTMKFQPRPGTADQTVLSVQSWIVRGSKKQVAHLALINQS